MSANIATITNRCILRLYNNGSPNKATLSSLRTSNSVISKKATTVWPLLFELMPERQLSRNGKPTYAEIAVFTSLRAYAIYQQGQENPVFVDIFDKDSDYNSARLFRVLSKLRLDEKIREGLDRRVKAVLASSNIDFVCRSLIHLIDILKSNQKAAKIDFAHLALDLYDYQFGYENARRICLRWGQDYFYLNDKVQGNEGVQK